MQNMKPIRVTRAGSLGRAGFEVCGTEITVVTTHPSVIASAALTVRHDLTRMDVVGGTHRARGADRLAVRAAHLVGCGVLVGVGGDIATAGRAPAGGLAGPHARRSGATEPVAVRLDSGGLATVRSAGPAAPWRSVTVAARSCRSARATAAAAVSRGQEALEWIGSLGCAARLVDADGVEQFAGWWPASRLAA